ncbi:MAG: carbon-nitrogen hydrolase family protein [Acidobacteria bacterium]|nr:carbon-nitrogen hydrolase family protein [Acidobacteriota bacterium]
MKPFSIAGIQMFVSAVHSNVEMMKHKIELTVSIYPWVDMILFSELCAFGPLTSHALVDTTEFEQVFCKLAKKHAIWIVPGSLYTKRDDKIYNSTLAINPQGEVVSRYDKLFPFYPYEEGVTPGTSFAYFDVPDIGRFGLTICYDLWFPEIARTLATHGVEVILHPTLTPTIDREVELAIVQATSATNQCFIFDVNGIGAGGNGRSSICGPEGRVLYTANVGEEIIPIELNMERVQRSREYGLLRLGQPLKSFRDCQVQFEIYQNKTPNAYLNSLGDLVKAPRKISLDKALEQFDKPNN